MELEKLIRQEIKKQEKITQGNIVDRGVESMARYACFVLQDILNKYQKGESDNEKTKV